MEGERKLQESKKGWKHTRQGTGPFGSSSQLVLFEGLDRINKFLWSTLALSDGYFWMGIAEVRKHAGREGRGHRGLRCSYNALNILAESMFQFGCFNSESPNENKCFSSHSFDLTLWHEWLSECQAGHACTYTPVSLSMRQDEHSAYLQPEFHIGGNIGSQLLWSRRRGWGRKRKAEMPIK